MSLELFHQFYHGNGTFFTIPVRYVRLAPFLSDKPFVVHAWDTVTQRPVVIKKVVLPDECHDSFHEKQSWRRAQRELYCMLFIEHDNIVKTYSTFTPAQNVFEMTEFYIVREFMEGTMKTLVPDTVDHFTVKSVFFDICKGVQYFHQMGVSHRDLKPQNILLCKNGDVKICDFGHSNYDDPNSNTPYTVQRYYRAPEIICETSDKNKTSVDIWSLGCILAELLTGNVLFRGSDYIDQFWQIVKMLGNPDQTFFNAMNPRARDFLGSQLSHDYQQPRSIHPYFPDTEFRGTMSQEPEQCALARDLLSRILVLNPHERVNVPTILMHPYLQDVFEDDGGIEPSSVPYANPPDSLRRFFGLHAYSIAEEMRNEIFSEIQKFGRQYNIFTGSRN